jgi:catechol 2,3-dioxygenase-like lactoylglutathione lyase family enzyme
MSDNQIVKPVGRAMPFVRLEHVQLAIPSGGEGVARDFYVDILGFEEIPKPPELAKRGGAWFCSGSVSLHLGVDSDFHPAKKAHPAFRCADYAALLQRLHVFGVPVIRDEQPFEGNEHCYISDPFGNRLELIAEPG